MSFQNVAWVVIGAQFGDEGKGRMIDEYAAPMGTEGLVIRFNGGAQAGHTVVTPDGRRHVFSHIGSGAFAGAGTFLSQFFVSHPMLFVKEIESLENKGIKPTVYVDPQSPVTTPYDMMVNQILEQARGAGRHGSCGLGFGETLERHLRAEYALTVANLEDRSALAGKLDAIRRDYVPARLARLGLADAMDRHADLWLSDSILEHFIEDVGHFLELTTRADLPTATQGRALLFEGAQGLLLDQDSGYFPHVTRSNTGLRNVLALVAALKLTRLEVTYVTRAYTTRHGAGPLPHELPAKPYPGIVDATNLPNDWQGALRFGWLDVDTLRKAIHMDLSETQRLPELAVKARLAVTCLDQVGDEKITYYANDSRQSATADEFAEIISRIIKLD